MSTAREQLLRVVELMVDRQDRVQVDEVPRGDAATLELRVAEEDLGKVIGRQGRTARAIRSLLGARESRGGGRYDFEIVDR